jgi:hypothetical protein
LTARGYNNGEMTESRFVLNCGLEECPGDFLTVRVQSGTVFVDGSDENGTSSI